MNRPGRLRHNEQMNGQSTGLAPAWLLTWLRPVDRAPMPTRRQIGADVLLAAAAGVVSLGLVVVVAKNPFGPPRSVIPLIGIRVSPPWSGMVGPVKFELLDVAARTVPLAIRRFRPLTAFWLCLCACMLAGHPDTDWVNFVALVPATYSALTYSRYRAAAVASVPAAVFVLAAPGLAMAGAVSDPHGALLTVEFAVVLVLFAADLRQWQQKARDSAAWLVRLQAETEAATRQALEQERARIASELHDVVTHNVSMMVVQAGGARRVLGAAPDEARSALLAIEESGRAAIVELQHLLGLLVPPGRLEDDDGPLPPQPGLDRVRPLIDRMRAAGLPAELVVSGTARPLPPGMDLAAYRVVQEALTNVIKHAGQTRTTVTLDYRDNALVIKVADDGRPDTPAAGGPRPGPGSPGPMPGTGRGLIGLRERVLLYGGELDTGRRPGGGWLVQARIPRDAPAGPAPA